MANTYDTSGLPLGTTSPKALYNNASNFDEAMNATAPTFTDRFGVSRETWAGMEAAFAEFLLNSGYFYTVPLDYEAGIVITLPNEIFRRDGEYYRGGPTITYPYTTTGDWATEGPLFIAVGDAALRTALAADDGATLVRYKQSFATSIARDVQSGLRDAVVSDLDFTSVQGAIDGVADTPRPVSLGGRTIDNPIAITNEFGTRIEDGKLLIPSKIAGKNTQLNTYADDVNGLIIARENLALFWLAVTLNTPFEVHWFGDSTVELGPGWPTKTHELFQMAMQDAGVNNAHSFNHGVGGTAWSDLDAVPYLGTNTKLIFIKYGINDALKADPLATLAADARAKLEEIRAQPLGGLQSVSIVLMGPNSTYCPSNGQDAKWYERLRNVYLQLCKEFDCTYFDTYAYLQQAKDAPGFWMDDLTSLGFPGEGLHPNLFAVYWIYRAALKDYLLGDGGWNTIKANTDWNLTNYTKPALAADAPTAYQYGRHQQLAFAANGFPIEGHLITQRQADGNTVQYIYTQDVVPRTASRRGSGSVWTQWTGVPIPVTVFTNSWANKGSGYAAAGLQIGDDGFVELYGVVASGVANTSVFTLPAGAWPAAAHTFRVANTGTVTIFNNGTVTTSSVDTTHLSLAGIRFPAAS